MKELLTKKEIEELRLAVEKAESNTSGEIATAIINESDDYANYEWSFAILKGFIYFFIMQFFTPQIKSLLQSMFWDYSDTYLHLLFV